MIVSLTKMNGNALPKQVIDLIDQVVKRTKLWPAEKRDVRAELESHFREGLEQLTEDAMGEAMAVTQLCEHFGDPTLAAKLIRRGKKRNRSMIWKIFMRQFMQVARRLSPSSRNCGR